MGRKRLGKVVEVLTQLGLAAVIGGFADAVVDGTRKTVDLYGIGTGIVLLVLAIWLTGYTNGDKL
ncbi:MAG: hypothetical protein HYT87_10460 [Nitrospirae bacterium]|nr:hypothetical protein [Nitrospirota bacterium]